MIKYLIIQTVSGIEQVDLKIGNLIYLGLSGNNIQLLCLLQCNLVRNAQDKIFNTSSQSRLY